MLIYYSFKYFPLQICGKIPFSFCSTYPEVMVFHQNSRLVFLSTYSKLQISHCFTQTYLIFFLFLHENICFGYLLEAPQNICCGYSLEAPHGGASNKYPQHMFSWRSKKNIIWITLLSRAKLTNNILRIRSLMCLSFISILQW